MATDSGRHAPAARAAGVNLRGIAGSISRNPISWYVALGAAPRLVLIFFYPEAAGDTETYKNVAENVLRGCGLSMSPAGGPDCVPHQGGQNFPGLPLFIAVTWFVFGRSDLALLLAPLALYLTALCWLLVVVSRLKDGRRLAAVCAVLLAVSPLTMPWVRFIAITETLSLAASMWILAELLESLRIGRLRGFGLALAFVAAVFVRAENVLLILPIAMVGVLMARRDLRKQAIVFFVTASIPFGAFIARNLMVGLPPVSPPAVLYKYALPVYPAGFHAWLDTWMTSEYQRADAIMPVWAKAYSKIRIEGSEFVGREERERVDTLLAQLSLHDGRPFPRHVDARFGALAREKRQSQGMGERMAIYGGRAGSLWLNPYSSYGFPIQTENREHRSAILADLERPGFGKYVTILTEYPGQVLGRAFILFYKAFLFIGIAVSVLAIPRLDSFTRRVIALVALAVISRTLCFVLMSNPPQIEARYVVSVVPWIEVMLALVLVRAVARWRFPAETVPVPV